jgi:hypothetical protein
VSGQVPNGADLRMAGGRPIPMDAALLEFCCSVDKFASAITALSYAVPSGLPPESSVSAKRHTVVTPILPQ